MGACYRHITAQDRLTIYTLLFEGYAIAEIAHQIGFHRATLYRELGRNSCQYGYRPDWASQQANNRTRRLSKLDKQPELKTFIFGKLKEGWSPEQIAGRLRKQAGRTLICHESIYRYIYSPKGYQQTLYRLLQKKRRFRYPRIKRRRRLLAEGKKTPVKERHDAINQRKTYGHWEGDLVLFHKTSTNLFTLRERKSRVLLAIKNPSRQAKTTSQTLLNYMKNNLHKTG